MKKETRLLWRHTLYCMLVALILFMAGYTLTHAGLSTHVFVLVPVCTGMVIAYVSKGIRTTAITALTSLLLSLSILLFTGLEGFGCVVMAFPILFLSFSVGAMFGNVLLRKTKPHNRNTPLLVVCGMVCLLIGWRGQHMADPSDLIVQTRMDFHAPMNKVWKSVTEPGSIQGDDRLLRLLGLPIPVSCTLEDDGARFCHFESGVMRQTVRESVYGKCYAVSIDVSFVVRTWLSFERAEYRFEQRGETVQVTRTDHIRSQLSPRWYWQWFEAQCVKLEHQYVLQAMKARSELGGTFRDAAFQ